MSDRSSLKFLNSTSGDLRVIVEPWANEFTLPAGSTCEVLSVGGRDPRPIELEAIDGALVFWISTEGALYEYWQDGVLVD